jgi:hypothetical protein
VHVSAYVEKLQKELSPPTVKQQLAAIRMLFYWMVVGQVIPTNSRTRCAGRAAQRQERQDAGALGGRGACAAARQLSRRTQGRENWRENAALGGPTRMSLIRRSLDEIELSAGEKAFVLGFAMGISGSAERNHVIAPRGSIAHMSDLLDSTATSFLLDAFIFSGNTGGTSDEMPRWKHPFGIRFHRRRLKALPLNTFLGNLDVVRLPQVSS